MHLLCWPLRWPCGSGGTVPSASPSTAGLGICPKLRGNSPSSQEKGATDGAEAASFAPPQLTSSRKKVTTDDAEAPRHRRVIPTCLVIIM